MKAGRSMQDLATEIQRQAKSKKDFIAPVPRLAVVEHPDAKQDTALKIDGQKNPLGIRQIFHDQLGDHLNIPRAYYRRLQTAAPDLLRTNVNHWMQRDSANRLVRTLDGDARAFLSDRYRTLDNVDLAEAVLPMIGDRKLKVVSCEITDRRLYLKAIDPKLEAAVGRRSLGDIVQGGLYISNSEVGHGSLQVAMFINRLACLNGMIVSEMGLKKYHIGKRLGDGEDKAWEVFRDETRQADDKALFMKIQDVAKAALTDKRFDDIVKGLNRAANDEIDKKAKVQDVVEVVRKNHSLTETEGASVLNHLIEGGDLSRWGLANAVTRTAHDVESYDRSDELERLGGKIIELSPRDWSAIASPN